MRPAFAAGIALAALAAAAPAAQAQAGSTTCRGSAARSTDAGAASEPVVANPAGTPCATDSRQVSGDVPVGALVVSNPSASTRFAPGVIAAAASVDGASLGGTGAVVSVGHVDAEQLESCAGGTSVTTGSSHVEGLMVGGQPVTIVGDQPSDQTVGGVRIRANQVDGTTRRALIVDVGAQEYVIAEVTTAGDACASLPGAATPPICATGSDYDPASATCRIVVRGADGAVTGTIVVSAAYAGPTGGSVLSLAAAQALARAGKLPNSRCLHGSGPKFVVLGTKHRDRITGAKTRDRILGLAGRDVVAGGRGNDCVDGGKGDDVVAGGRGNDRLRGGPGADRQSGGAGKDTINTDRGRDRVHGGAGNDRINAVAHGKPATVFAGAGRDTVRINRNERRRVHGAERVIVVR